MNEEFFAESVRFLTDRDSHLAEVVEQYGQPPLWIREPGFPTLVYIILEQQVSLASAKADDLSSRIANEMQEAVTFALKSPFPKLESALEYNYA